MGVLLALGIHDVDIYVNIKGERPSTIYCEVQENILPGIEDSAMILMTFPDGAKGYIHESWSYPVDDKLRRLSVIGRRMSAVIDYLRPNEITVFDRRIDDSEGLELRDEGHRVEMVNYSEPLTEELRDFVRSCASRGPPAADMYIGLAAVEMVEAAIRSAREGRAVRLGDQ